MRFKFLQNIVDAISEETDTIELRRKKLMFVLISYFSAFIGLLLCLQLLFGFKNNESSFIIFAYSAIVIVNVLLFLLHKEFELHANFFLILTLFTPFLIHLFFINDMTTMPLTWGIIVPVAALLIGNSKRALFWLIDYIAIVIITSFIDKYYFHTGAITIDWNFFSGQISTIFLAVLLLFVFHHYVRKAENLSTDHTSLVDEHNRAKDLLNNLLPEEIAMRLKHEKSMIADNIDNVTVLFADMVGFTQLSSKLHPKELVDLLNVIFSSFDMIAEDLGLEKIKTMGDAYMAASGIPNGREDHAEAAADAALKFLEEVRKFNELAGIDIKVRIGLHSGPVVAGVIGIKKTVYDLWGDTVNVAARMEHHGLPDRVQVTKETYNLLKGKYSFISRGEINVKGKGLMETYLLLDKVQNLNLQKIRVKKDLKMF